MENITYKYARFSLVSIVATSIVATVHHIYKLGPGAFLLGAVIIVLPIALMLWFRKTSSSAALISYGLMNVWIIVGFGLVDGLWDHTLKIYLGNFLLSNYSYYFSWSPIGGFPFEATGILESVGSLFAAYYGYKFLRTAYSNELAGQVSKYFIGAFAVIGLFIGGYAVTRSNGDTSAVPEGGVIRIGVIVPTTGPAALLGNSFVKAVQVAKEDLKNTRYRYELVIESSSTISPAATKRAIQKLIKVDKVRAIVGGISLSGQVVKPYATMAKIPHLCVCSVKTVGDGVYNFTNIPLAEDEAIRWVEEARKRGIGTIALLTQIYPSIDGHVKALKEEAARKGMRVVYENRFEAATTDFTSRIADARASAPDVYFLEAFEPALDILGQQLNDAGVHNIASVVAFSLSGKKGLFEGAWYTDSNLVDAGFSARFEQKYPGTEFVTHMMPYAYDSFNLLVKGFESGQNIAEYVHGVTEYEGSAGKVTREAGSGNFRSIPAVWVIKNGKLKLLY
jgi:ABC-type branched-subunit amino acid transport system substrate-binding protein